MSHKIIKEVNAVNILSGLTLVEMLISLSLGTLLLWIAAQFYVDVFSSQTKQRELLKLQQNAHQLLNYMQKHIQHIGYQGANRKQSNYELFLKNNQAYELPQSQCFIFFYDVNNDGCIGNRHKTLSCNQNGINQAKEVHKEIFGFKFVSKNLFVLDDKRMSNCSGENCQNWANCEQNKWLNMTELADYQVENLAFNWEKPQALLRIDLTLRSVKFYQITYRITAYSYLLNSRE